MGASGAPFLYVRQAIGQKEHGFGMAGAKNRMRGDGSGC
jgi:hypothetical protein